MFLSNVVTAERAGGVRPVPSPVVRRLLTERLVTVPPERVSTDASAVFHTAFQHVAKQARGTTVARDWSGSMDTVNNSLLLLKWSAGLNAGGEAGDSSGQ